MTYRLSRVVQVIGVVVFVVFALAAESQAQQQNILIGGNGNDRIFGNIGNDSIEGGPGDDELYGDSGDDTLDGGPGADIIDGGDGIDTQSNTVLSECSIDTVTNVEIDGCVYVHPVSMTVPADGTYTHGQTLTFTVTFDGNVTVSGSPLLRLTIGSETADAGYVSGTGTPTLTFEHLLSSGADDDGIEIADAIELNGGTVTDTQGRTIPLTLTGLVPSTEGILVVPPVSQPVSMTVPADGTYIHGQTLTFSVTFDGNVTVSGSPALRLTIGSDTVDAGYVSGTGTPTLTFQHLLSSGTDDDGIEVAQAIALNGGTLTDAQGHAVSSSIAGVVPATEGILVAPPVRAYSGPSPTGTGTITAMFTGGGLGCAFTSARFIPLTGDPASPPSAPDGDYLFPHGLFDFTTTGCEPGDSITMTVTYPEPLPSDTQYWKYGPTGTDTTPHWYTIPATIDGDRVVFTIVDGGLGDDDLSPNGTIVDQGGPAVPVMPVPTMPQWLLILSALGAGWLALRAMARGARARA
jgi:hypothetical protein